MMGLPMAYHALGRKADSDAALAALIAKYGKDAPYDVAYIYAFRGEADRAFEWLDKAAARTTPSLILVLVENLFANIHSDPRWLPFLRKLGKAPEQLGEDSVQGDAAGGKPRRPDRRVTAPTPTSAPTPRHPPPPRHPPHPTSS